MKFQKAVGNLAYWIGFDILILKFGDSGIHINKNENIDKPHLRQEVLAKKKFQTLGYNAIDDLLEFLEENETAYPLWTGSEASTFQKKFFLRSTAEFNNIVNINQSRLVYMASLQYQLQVEDFYILPLIGRELFDQIKNQMVTDILTTANNRLLEFIQKAVAHLTVYKGGYEFALLIMNKFYSKMGSATGILTDMDAVDDMYLKDVVQNAKATGTAYLQSVEGFLRKNIADYPLYATSTAYDENGSVFRKFNNMGKKIVTM